jgi:hypothetical protein
VRAASECGWLAAGLIACGVTACATPSQPPRESFEQLGTDQFRFVSTATMMHPVNSRQGEHFRMGRLAERLREEGVCRSGYTIVSRNPPMFFSNDSRYEYAVRDVTYIGQCKS